jgi:hypothetical protein
MWFVSIHIVWFGCWIGRREVPRSRTCDRRPTLRLTSQSLDAGEPSGSRRVVIRRSAQESEQHFLGQIVVLSQESL